MGGREDSPASIQLCGYLEPTGFLGGWTPTAYLKCIPFFCPSPAPLGSQVYMHSCVCVSPQPKPGEQPLFLLRARPLWLAPPGHLWLGNSHGLLDSSTQDSVLHMLVLPLNWSRPLGKRMSLRKVSFRVCVSQLGRPPLHLTTVRECSEIA